MHGASIPANAIQLIANQEISEENPWPDFERHHMKRNGVTAWARRTKKDQWKQVKLKTSRVEDIHCILTAHPTQGLIDSDGTTWLIAYSGLKRPAEVVPAPDSTYGWKTTRGPYYTVFVAMYHQGLFQLKSGKRTAATSLQRVITEADL